MLVNDTDCALCNTQQRAQPPLALAVPLSRFTPRVGGGSAFFVRQLRTPHERRAIRTTTTFGESVRLLVRYASLDCLHGSFGCVCRYAVRTDVGCLLVQGH